MSENQSDESLDARGRRCSMLSMMVAEKIGPLSPGAVLEVLTDDPGAPTEMPAWCRRAGHDLLGLEPTGEEFRLRIRRGG
jgi:tRNA 2-thiouridine synthesizing protein A